MFRGRRRFYTQAQMCSEPAGLNQERVEVLSFGDGAVMLAPCDIPCGCAWQRAPRQRRHLRCGTSPHKGRRHGGVLHFALQAGSVQMQ